MVEKISVDIVVIGSGSAGLKAAVQASKLDKTVVIIEGGNIGGTAVHQGTIPSKALREAIIDLTHFQMRSFYATKAHLPDSEKISITDLNYRMNWVSKHLSETTVHHLKKNGIIIVDGFAKFQDPYTMDVYDQDGKVTHQVKAEKIILTCGSKPRVPKNVECDGKYIFTSTQLLDLDHVPKSMACVGAGVIGCEFASMFSILGTQVTLIDKRPEILSFADREIVSHLKIFMEANNLTFLGDKDYETIRVENDEVVVKFTDGTETRADTALIAAGRIANLDGMHIEKSGLTLDPRGYLDVNQRFQTKVDHIYAAGDIVHGPALSATAIIQGRIAARNACGVPTDFCFKRFPIGIYTIPDISMIGVTEEQAKKEGLDYEVGRAYAYENSRCLITGEEVGLCKLIFDRKNLKLLGACIIGRAACEMIHIAQLAISFNATIEYFVENVFNVPTYAESFRVAALNGINKVRTTDVKR